jgi:hypothetical protein
VRGAVDGRLFAVTLLDIGSKDPWGASGSGGGRGCFEMREGKC